MRCAGTGCDSCPDRSSHRSVGCNSDHSDVAGALAHRSSHRSVGCNICTTRGSQRSTHRSSHRSVGCNLAWSMSTSTALIAPRTGAWVAMFISRYHSRLAASLLAQERGLQ